MNPLSAMFEGSPNKKETAMSRIPLVLVVPLLSAVLSLDVNAKPPATGVVRGHGKVPSSAGGFLPSQISINAWLDSEGAHGRVIWIGDFEFVPGDPQGKGGPADPWFIDVTSISFLPNNSAEICGVVVHAPRRQLGKKAVRSTLITEGLARPTPSMASLSLLATSW
ncbi:hypothetical protein [Nannocystis radixulma]|uniref:Uncharacterized protein n=1 Tax=Nannocystis radixulma TaxID=2995305 RepID=A0ABT5BDD2_9BACT|nr:hypothetical protein [Nannocystis radixulma]MDC0672131.1 hypothetical protein [Nannocystis radixulma]